MIRPEKLRANAASYVRRLASPTIDDVVFAGLCMGCGACESLIGADRVRVEWDEQGACRPRVLVPLDPHTQARFRAVCPGIRMHLSADLRSMSAPSHDLIFGSVQRIVEAYATDCEVRFLGSSGGVLSTLALHLLESGQAQAVLHVAASETHPLRSRSQVSRDRAGVLGAAGSRYGPAAPLVSLAGLLAGGERFAVVGKPCDIAAVRNLAALDPRVDGQVVALLSVMCGGQAEMSLIWRLLEGHGVGEDEVTGFRCRGRGCPGPTVIDTRAGRHLEFTYDEVWNDNLHGWGLPFRCKICPDSQGEQADLVCFDSVAPEHVDGESEGFNTVMVRTHRGSRLLDAATASGAVTVTRGLTVEALHEWQPHIVRRHEGALARLIGAAARSGVVPRVGGYRLLAAARRQSVWGFGRNVRGAWQRAGAVVSAGNEVHDRLASRSGDRTSQCASTSSASSHALTCGRTSYAPQRIQGRHD